jgi:hypothetical protein
MTAMKKNTLSLAASLIAITASMTSFSPAALAEAMTFHGAICQVFDPAKAGQVQTHHSGVINTSTTTSVVVTCPLARDNHANTNGTTSVAVRGIRNSLAGVIPFSCTLVSRDINGNALESATNQITTTGAFYLPLDVNVSGYGGYYAVSCTVPPKSSVSGIFLGEP